MGCDGVVPRNKTVATGFGPRGQGPMNGDCSCCWYPGTFRLWHESAPHTCHVNIAGFRTAAHVAIPAYPAGVCVCVCVCAYTDIDIDNGVPRHRRKAEIGAHERDERIGKRLRPFEALKVLILFARSTPEAWQAVVAPAVSVTGGLTGLVQLQKPIAIAAAATRWPRRGVSAIAEFKKTCLLVSSQPGRAAKPSFCRCSGWRWPWRRTWRRPTSSRMCC